MNEFTLRGYWNVMRGKFKQKVGRWTKDDSLFSKGREDELVGRLQRKIGRMMRQMHPKLAASGHDRK